MLPALENCSLDSSLDTPRWRGDPQFPAEALKQTTLILILAALLAGLLLIKSFFRGDEGQIRAQLNDLASLTSFPANEGNLQTVGRAKQLSELFAEAVTINIRAAGQRVSQSGGRQEVMQAALAIKNQVSSLDARWQDIDVRLSEDKRSALVEATGRARIAEQDDSGVEEFIIHLRKFDDQWLIERIENRNDVR